MLRNYFVIAMRNLVRQKGYSILNILGLAVGMAACILILLYVQFELSYDKFYADYERVHRVVINFMKQDGSKQIGFACVAAPYGPHLRADAPEIEYVARLDHNNEMLIVYGDKNFVEDNFYHAERDVLNIFSIPIILGDRETALVNTTDLMLSQSMATKIFGDENPIGKELLIHGEHPFTVTAVFEDSPANSHIHFNFFTPLEAIKYVWEEEYPGYWERSFMSDNIGSNNVLTYVKLHEGVDPIVFDKKIRTFIDTFKEGYDDAEGVHHPASERRQLQLQNLADIHLTSKQNSEYEANGDIRYVKLFGLIAGFVLFIACINFMNMSTAKAVGRAREVGLRKVIGANRKMLVNQFLGESLIITFVSLLIAILMVILVLPHFANFVERDLQFNPLTNSTLLLMIGAVFFIVGIVAGLYPAIYLSSFRPITILRGELTRGKRGALMRKTLVVFQFVISVALIACVSVVFSQLKYMNDKDLGFDKENILIVYGDTEIRNHWRDVKAQMVNLPGVVSATASKRIPSGELNDWNGWSAEVNGVELNNDFRLPNQRIDYDFFKTYDMELLAGRTFREEIVSDSDTGIILNEIAVKQLGYSDPNEAIGKHLKYGNTDCEIIGVVKNFHFESLHEEICPIVFHLSNSIQCLSIRIAPGNVQNTLADIQGVWDNFHSGSSAEMTYSFLDDRIQQQYPHDNKLMTLFGMFSLLAILISCLGLIGLSAFTAEKKSREIGVRKVLGASISSILTLLSSEYVKLVIIGTLIASPLAWYAMRQWLNSFAYRMDLHVGYFIVATLAVFAIAMMAVLSQALRAATLNPTDALRRE
jgi:putative ABC transport system permease protein